MVDTNSLSVKLQPENSIILDKWTGDIYDTSLKDLGAFLLSKSHCMIIALYAFEKATIAKAK